ncbi:hypothetical protein OOU_Y34scaffold00247g58 [Pyricularia oryzae Y34]|uniref:Uncharacterized protein n=2 Tax=Pyricularia oryzae TaxID=318829 RepID=A0AA97P4R1_PYRO3|nr:hypothetical protein OOU_Y34scaffold00247g58 [Pyricularia oryzae Y34]
MIHYLSRQESAQPSRRSHAEKVSMAISRSQAGFCATTEAR